PLPASPARQRSATRSRASGSRAALRRKQVCCSLHEGERGAAGSAAAETGLAFPLKCLEAFRGIGGRLEHRVLANRLCGQYLLERARALQDPLRAAECGCRPLGEIVGHATGLCCQLTRWVRAIDQSDTSR